MWKLTKSPLHFIVQPTWSNQHWCREFDH